jgi:arsenite methyltransferase
MSEVDIKEVVRERYAEIARNVRAPGSSCCYDGESGSEGISANLYADDETRSLPENAVLASLGCGNPTALAELKEGRRFLISARAAALTFCSQPAAWAPSERPTGST